MVLLRNNHDLIANVAKLIIEYNFILNIITFRALIAKLVHINVTLAKRLHQIAINLGIYSKLQVSI